MLSQELVASVRLIVFDFDGVFTDNTVYVDQNGIETVRCSRADGFGLDAARKAGIELMVLSTEKNPVVTARCTKLKLRCVQGCDNKAAFLKKEAAELGIELSSIAYLGNDINDLGCLDIVGLPACVADSYPEVIERSMFITRRDGGNGAVREFCEFIVKAKSLAKDREGAYEQFAVV